jgi:hypothetical protein
MGGHRESRTLTGSSRTTLSTPAQAGTVFSDGCRVAARAWSEWKARQRYRSRAAGKQKRNGQSRRYRERVKDRKRSEKEAVPETARVITKKFFRGLLRPAGLL